MISRGKNWFVNEVHIPNAELRTSAELLTELRKSEGGECVLGQSNTSNQETGPAHVSSHIGNKETCADTLSTPPSQAFFHTQRTIPTTERKWKVVCANLRTELCQYRTPQWLQERCFISIKMNDNLTPHFIGTRQGQYCWKRSQNMDHEVSQKKHWLRQIHEGSSSTRFEYFEDSKKIPWPHFRAIQGHSGGTPIDPGLMEYIQIPYIGKSILPQRLFSQHSVYPWERDWFPVGMKATKDGKRSSSHHLTLTLLVEIPTTKNLKNAESEPIFKKKIQGQSRAPWWHCEGRLWSLGSFHWTGLVCVPNDCRKSNGCYCKITRLWRTSSWCSVCLHSSNIGGRSQIARNSKVRMSRLVGTSSTTQMTEILCDHWRSCGTSRTKFVRTPTCWPLVGKTIRRSFIRTWMGKVSNWECLFVHRRHWLFLIGTRGRQKMARMKRNMAPMCKNMRKHVDLEEPTSFLDHVYLECTQRECKPNEIIIEGYTKVFESRMSAGTTKNCQGGKRLTQKK